MIDRGKITHMWRWGTPQNFLLALFDELGKTRKIRILKKWKRIAGEIIISHMCTKNHNLMRYSSWGTEWDKLFWDFGPFFTFYIPPPPPNNPENQNFQKMKKASGDVIILNSFNKKHNQIMYAYSDMENERHNFLSF